MSSRLSVEYTLSAGWERFCKAIPDTCGRPLIKCFESKYVKSMLFHFPMNVVLFQRIWSFSFNRFVSLNQIHRMANQVGDKSQRAVHLNFSKVSDFHCLRIPWYLLFLIQFELRDSENYHSQLKTLLPKIQIRDLARVSIIRQTYYHNLIYIDITTEKRSKEPLSWIKVNPLDLFIGLCADLLINGMCRSVYELFYYSWLFVYLFFFSFLTGKNWLSYGAQLL